MQIREALLTEIRSIIAASREAAIRSVDYQRVRMCWAIGQKIFEEEQGARDRAKYGSYLLKYLAEELEPVFGTGFSRRQLERYRQFYRTFPIASTLRTQFSWTHYKLLISIDKEEKQSFENRTIGILLCADKNDTVVKYSLPENNGQIVTSKYQLYLPSEQQLIEEVKKELESKEQTDSEHTNAKPKTPNLKPE